MACIFSLLKSLSGISFDANDLERELYVAESISFWAKLAFPDTRGMFSAARYCMRARVLFR